MGVRLRRVKRLVGRGGPGGGRKVKEVEEGGGALASGRGVVEVGLIHAVGR